MQKPKLGYSQDKHYIRFLRKIPVDDVLPHIGEHKYFFWGIPIRLRSDRYLNFVNNGTKCMCCGLEGAYFYLETGIGKKERRFRNPESQHMTRQQQDSLHLNLYGVAENGKEVMLTKDHIVPKAEGGEDVIENFQTLCRSCNERKGTLSMAEFMERKKRRERR